MQRSFKAFNSECNQGQFTATEDKVKKNTVISKCNWYNMFK